MSEWQFQSSDAKLIELVAGNPKIRLKMIGRYLQKISEKDL